jgi:hypothetical protein
MMPAAIRNPFINDPSASKSIENTKHASEERSSLRRCSAQRTNLPIVFAGYPRPPAGAARPWRPVFDPDQHGRLRRPRRRRVWWRPRLRWWRFPRRRSGRWRNMVIASERLPCGHYGSGDPYSYSSPTATLRRLLFNSPAADDTIRMASAGDSGVRLSHIN